MNIHYFRDGYCHRARCRNINSARFAAAATRKGGERTAEERKEGRKGREGEGAQYPTLFHFTVDPVASFRSLELDLIKIRAGEALTPPIKSPNHSRPRPPQPLGENRHSARERYPASIGRGRVYKGGTFRADLTDLPQINRTPVSRRVCDKNGESRLLNYSGKL